MHFVICPVQQRWRRKNVKEKWKSIHQEALFCQINLHMRDQGHSKSQGPYPYFSDTTNPKKQEEDALGAAVAESEDLLIVHKNELLLHVNINQFFTKVVSIPHNYISRNCSWGKNRYILGTRKKLKNCTQSLHFSPTPVAYTRFASLTLIYFVIRLFLYSGGAAYSCVSSFKSIKQFRLNYLDISG